MTASSTGRVPRSSPRVVRAIRPAPGLLSLLLLSGSVFADATIQLPATASGDVGDFIQVPATTSGAQVRWYSVDRALKLFPVNLLKDTKTAVCIGKVAGSYRLLAWTSDASGPSDAAVCVVTVGTPTPPTPPVPPTPPPTDPLAQALVAAYAIETDPTKASQVQVLAGFYRQASLTVIGDATLNTTADLLAKLVAQRKTVLADTALPKVRALIDGQLSAAFSQSMPLDVALRKRLGDLFSHYADLVGGLK